MSNSIGEENVKHILKKYFPNRFQGISADDFEYLVKLLLEKKFDSAKVTQSTGDFGADVIAKDHDDNKIICQVKRYKEGNKVGNKYINDCIGAIEYYNGDVGLVITTSDFTDAAIELSDKANIELWNWNKLTSEISQHFWDGKDYNEFFDLEQINSTENIQENLDFEITTIEYSTTEKDIPGNWIYISITNQREQIVEVQFSEITVIAHDNSQYSIDFWHNGYFSGGKIYPKAEVELSFFIKQQKAGRLKKGTKIYIAAHVEEDEKLVKLVYEGEDGADGDATKYLNAVYSDDEIFKDISDEISEDTVFIYSPVAGELSFRESFREGKILNNPEEVLCKVGNCFLKAGITGKITDINTALSDGDTITQHEFLLVVDIGKDKSPTEKLVPINKLPEKLIQEKVSENIVLLKSPIEGNFRRFIPNLINQKIEPDLIFGKIEGIKLKCGIQGNLIEMIAEDGYLKKGDPMLKVEQATK